MVTNSIGRRESSILRHSPFHPRGERGIAKRTDHDVPRDFQNDLKPFACFGEQPEKASSENCDGNKYDKELSQKVFDELPSLGGRVWSSQRLEKSESSSS